MKLYLFLLLSSLAIAAQADERAARIMYYGAPSGAPEKAIVYQANQGAEEVVLDRWNFSESFKLSDAAVRLAFLPSALPEDAPVPESAPSVNVPQEWKKVLILVFEDKSNPVMPIRLEAINANDDAFGPGELYFVNLSEMTVFGLVGDKKLISKPRTTEIVSHPRRELGTYMLKLDAMKDGLKSRRSLVQQKCQYDPTVRVITLILPMPPPRSVKLYSAPINKFGNEPKK